MPRVDPHPDLAHALADISLPAAGGDVVRLGDRWADGPAILVHLRHFGWLFCRQHVAQLRDAVEEIEAVATLTAIGTGDVVYAEAFAEEQGVTFPLLVDDSSASYRAVGTRKGTRMALLSPRLAMSSARAMAAGHRQGKPGRAPMVLGATHVILPDATVPFAWVNDDFDDNAPIAEVLTALP